MKLALISTFTETSAVSRAFLLGLLPYWEQEHELALFTVPELADAAIAGHRLHSTSELDPRAWDRLLYSISNRPEQAGLLPLLAKHGGIAALHDWNLFDLACARWPALHQPGLAGHWITLREGGLAALRARVALLHEGGHKLEELRSSVPFQRAVVRRADAFLVHSRWLRDQILAERRVPTPIALVPQELQALPGRSDPTQEQSLSCAQIEGWQLAQVAEQISQVLRHFPEHLMRRKSLIRAAIAAADEDRRLRAQKKAAEEAADK